MQNLSRLHAGVLLEETCVPPFDAIEWAVEVLVGKTVVNNRETVGAVEHNFP